VHGYYAGDKQLATPHANYVSVVPCFGGASNRRVWLRCVKREDQDVLTCARARVRLVQTVTRGRTETAPFTSPTRCTHRRASSIQSSRSFHQSTCFSTQVTRPLRSTLALKEGPLAANGVWCGVVCEGCSIRIIEWELIGAARGTPSGTTVRIRRQMTFDAEAYIGRMLRTNPVLKYAAGTRQKRSVWSDSY
jgi:hypothetical protein